MRGAAVRGTDRIRTPGFRSWSFWETHHDPRPSAFTKPRRTDYNRADGTVCGLFSPRKHVIEPHGIRPCTLHRLQRSFVSAA